MFRKRNFINKDLENKVIRQNPKDSKSVEIDGNSRFAGHRFLLKTKLYGDKRCMICGKWFHWDSKDWFKWVSEGNVEKGNRDNVKEPFHCGNSHCSDFWNRFKQVQAKRANINAERDTEYFSLFKSLQKNRVVI